VLQPGSRSSTSHYWWLPHSTVDDPDEQAGYPHDWAGTDRYSLSERRYFIPSKKTPKKRQLDELASVFPNAAGLDIGSAEIVAAVPTDRDPEPVRVFQTFTPDLHALVAWVVESGIDTVAMESTGVFWIPIYELLERAGITPYLVNARHVKTVPGRKTDWNDAPCGCHSLLGRPLPIKGDLGRRQPIEQLRKQDSIEAGRARISRW
jgi:hypothetical protein